MGNKFSGSEIVEMGIQIEVNGRDFYNALVIKINDQKAKEIFRYLAEEEGKHITTFKEILDSVQKYEPKEAYPDEYFAYMNSLASDYVFTRKDKGAEAAENVEDEKDAIDLGIGFEKDSITFYEGMKKIVPENDQELIDDLIAQEQDHLRQLTGLKEDL